jgi:hypothetical protein
MSEEPVSNETTDTPTTTEPDIHRVAGNLAPAPGGLTCPTCGASLPDLDAEYERVEEAFNAHSRLLEALGDGVTGEQVMELELAASDLHGATLEGVRTRLRRLRPELADLIDVATEAADYDAWPVWRTYLHRRLRAADHAPGEEPPA